MAENNKSLLPPANNQIWIPPVSQQKALARRHKGNSIDPEVSNALWLPPSSPKEHTLVTSSNISPSRTRLNMKPDLHSKPRFNFRPGFSIQPLLKPFSTIHLNLGFKDKHLWDWLPLFIHLFVALVIAASIFLGFSRFASQQTQQQNYLAQQTFQEQVLLAQQQAVEQEHLVTQIVQKQQLLVQQQSSIVDQGHEQILTTYLNSMADLLPALKKPNPDAATRLLAQTKTLAIFNALKADPIRIGIVLQFLHDAGLISVPTHNSKGPIIPLNNAVLSGLSLKQANLSSTSFDGATLSGADLTQAVLTSSSFRGAILTKVLFTNANLTNADFSGANLENADFTGATLKGANLNGADTKNAKLKNVIW